MSVGNWRDIAAAAQRQERRQEPLPDNFGLPDGLSQALRELEILQPPKKLEKSANWQGVVTDAMTIAREQWAAAALALGWSAEDLFGIGPRDDWDFQGLAVWLDGRRLIMLDEAKAIAADVSGERRAVFLRGGMRHGTHPFITPVMLWDFGR